MIPEDITGVDTTLARRILSVARSIAPCVDSLEGEPKANAVAILQGVAGEAKARGSRLIASQRIPSAQVTYRDVGSWFSDDDRAALKAICGAVSSAGHPIGTFPAAASAFGRIWPEEIS